VWKRKRRRLLRLKEFGRGMSNLPPYQRGDVVLTNSPLITDFGQAKLRPAVIVQNDIGNQFSLNLIVLAVSSQIPRKNYPTSHIIRYGTPAAQAAGLDRDSVVMAQMVVTIPKTAVTRLIGHLDAATMTAVDACLRVSLNL